MNHKRLSALVAVLALALCGVAAADEPLHRVVLHIASQPVDRALAELGDQAGIQLLVRAEDIRADQAPAPQIAGELSVREALDRILANTGLTYEFLNERTVRVRVSKAAAPSSNPSTGKPTTRTSSASDAPLRSGEDTELQEVVVTAQKREERLQDVPVPVTSLSTEELASTNQVRLQDYFTRIPGLTVTPSEFNGTATISIRGVTSGDFTNPTVGITVDDMPYGSTTALGGGYLVPDLDPSDLARIEVLRGPQGTLYGASSIGGLLKYVTVDPSSHELMGRLQAGASWVHGGAQPGYNLSGSINLPVSDSFAIRASAFTRRDAGYIDNIQTGRQDVNQAEVSGGHLSALWKPVDDLSLKFSALVQDSHLFGAPSVTIAPGLGDLQQSFLAGTGFVDRKFQAYALTVKAKLGRFDLTSISGYSINNLEDRADYTSALGACCTSAVFGVPGTPNTDVNRTNKFSQEFRLATAVGSHLDFMLGAFYTHEYSPFLEQFLAADDVSGTTVGTLANFDWFVTYNELAGFVDLTYKVTERFDVQLGARESEIRQSYAEVDSGPYVPLFELPGQVGPLYFPEVIVHDNAFTYLLTPRFKFTPDLMAYARIASGYRPGGPNATASVFGLPQSFSPDKTKNYEIGLKGDFLQRKLSIDMSVFYIDWQHIQISLIDPTVFLSYFTNGTKAKSEGVELSFEAKPLDGLNLAAAATWNEAVLTQDFPHATIGAFGSAGDRLPYTSRFAGSFSAEQQFHLSDRWSAFAGATLSYVGDRLGAFASTPQRQLLPGYSRIDLRTGVKCGTWQGDLYVNNAADRRGVLGGGIGTFVPTSFQLIQPRTIGINLIKTFQ